MSFINYRASAGSGKTYQLVLEYLALALKDNKRDNFKHILAITFTNKAAAEMKERILRSLKELSKGENEELKKNLLERAPSLKDIEKRAAQVLKKILHNYSNFAVTTIDSFISRLVRSFTYETDIPAGFDVELNLNRLNNYIIKNIFSDIGVDPDTTNIILEFVLDRINRERSWNVESNIIPILSEINRERKEGELENIAGMAPGDFLRISGRLKKIFMDYSGEMRALGEKGIKLIEDNGFSPTDFSYKYSGAAGYLNRLAGINLFAVSDTVPTARFTEGKWTAQNSSDELIDKMDGIFGEELLAIHSEIISLYNKKFKAAFSAFLVFENIYLLGLINRIRKYLNEYKSEYNVVPIYDLTKNVHRIILKGDIPFIYYILGDSFEHIMIDEFQDTSIMQWDSLFPLIENSVSEEKLNLGVGDLKQSIYRWRGGETDIMDKQIHEQFLPWGGVDSKELPDNFRSRENIVNFNNKLFSSVKELGKPNDLIPKIYEEAGQNCRLTGGGFVSLRFVSKEDTEETVPEQVEKIVKHCLDSGFSLSDIAVLTRKKAPGIEIAAHLIASGKSIISPELLLLYRNPVALFMISLLKYTANNTQDHILADILSFVSKYFTGNIWSEDKTGQYFMDRESIQLPDPVSTFVSSGNRLIRVPIYEAAEELIRIFDLGNTLELSSAGYLTAFLDMVKDFSEKEGGSIPEFLEWWEDYGTQYSVPTPENGNGVTLMTIHKAKGLEFPVVIIPYADWRDRNEKNLWMKPASESMKLEGYPPPYFVKAKNSLEDSLFSTAWVDEKYRSELDDLNLFYVACTRAKEALFIFSEDKKEKKNGFHNGQLLKEISGSDFFNTSEGTLFEKGTLERSGFKKDKRSLEVIKDKDLISTRWSGRVTIRERSEKFWAPHPEEVLEKIDRGIIIHEILSEISTKQRPDMILDRMVYSGRIDRQDMDEISGLIEDMFTLEPVRDWFYGEGEHLMEQPILTKAGTYRPDRIILKGDSVTVIDFKTGRESDSDGEQVNNYKTLILNMGYKEVKGKIFYLSTRKIIEV